MNDNTLAMEKYTIKEFFEKFSWIKKNALAREIGISPSLMRQYACGTSKPSKKRVALIESELKRLTEELQHSSINKIDE